MNTLTFVFGLVAVLISSTLYSQTEEDWNISTAIDHYITVFKSNNEEILEGTILIKDSSNRSIYFKEFSIEGGQVLGLDFPDDFESLTEVKLPVVQQLVVELKEKRGSRYRKKFTYDPSPNSTLQLNSYTPKTKIDKKLFWGEYIDAYQWEDKRGENVIIRSALAHQIHLDSELVYNKYLYLYHYQVKNDSFKLIRKFTDSYKTCSSTFGTNFKLPSVELTDINRDTIGEISTVYELRCQETDTLPFKSKVLLTTAGEKYMYYGYVDPCKLENHIETEPGSLNIELRPYYGRFMRKKLLKYYP